MKTKSLGLAWIPVKDFDKAIHFYTEIVGLKLMEMNKEWGWAELEGHEGGSRLGIARYDANSEKECPVKPGQNAILSFEVDNIEKAVAELQKKGAKFIGDMEEVPGHVKMQLVEDCDGNRIHLTEVIAHHPQSAHSKHEHSGGCCGGH